MNSLMKLKERIKSNTELIPATGCWVWLGSNIKGKYGTLSVKNKATLVHRASYEAYVSEIPKGLEIDHLCRTTLCVNPTHLEPVTPSENRKRQGRAVSHCPRGHEYTTENTLTNPRVGASPTRRCKACTYEKNRVARLKRIARSGLLPSE